MYACASFKIEDFNKDCHLLGDHGFPKENNQPLRACMHVTGFEPVMFY